MSEQRPTSEAELIELVRAIDVGAPERLHERVMALTAQAGERGGGRGLSFGFGPRLGWRLGSAVVASAAVVLALVLSLTGTGTSGLSLREASALTLRPATMGPPAEDVSAKGRLDAGVDGVSFPYWTERFGWRASGARLDRVDGRRIKTVFYTDRRGRRVGYAIVAGTPAPRVGAGTMRWRDGTSYGVSAEDGVEVVTWLRDGRLCVVSGRDVSARTLIALASWDDDDSIS